MVYLEQNDKFYDSLQFDKRLAAGSLVWRIRANCAFSGMFQHDHPGCVNLSRYFIAYCLKYTIDLPWTLLYGTVYNLTLHFRRTLLLFELCNVFSILGLPYCILMTCLGIVMSVIG